MASTSQSVRRAFEVFKLFASERRSLSTIEIAESLGAPRSSCAALLKTLFDLNLLSMDRRASRYFPTAEFAELGAWLNADELYPPNLLSSLEALSAETGETVTLAAYNDLMIELVDVFSSRQAISFSAEKGQRFAVWRSALGTAYLTRLDTAQIRALYKRSLDRRVIANDEIDIENVIETVSQARRAGYAFAKGVVFPDASAMACDTGLDNNGRPLIFAIAGPTERMERNEDAFSRRLLDAATGFTEAS
ncbi:MAG: helix-turn-helix domain-containing protein [Pseudomonadota bacterium]